MVRSPEQLNQSQVDVLKWVADGCPDGVYTDGWQHRIVARALHNRGLVSVAGKGASWRATLTKAGRVWLDAPPTDILPGAAEADRLLEQVIEAGGELKVSAAQGPELRRLLQVIRMSLHSTKRPNGKMLEIRSVGYRYGPERTLELVDNLDELVEVRPVRVPERVAKYHPAVKHFLEIRDWQYVTKEHLSRAARILQAVADEAERRSFQVLETSEAKANQDRPTYKPVQGHIWIVTDHGDYSVTMKEIAGSGGRSIDYQERYRSKGPTWQTRRSTEFVSTGRLELVLDGRFAPYSGQHFRDAKTKTVEGRLPEVFAALDKYQLESDRREEAQRRAEAERQRARDEATARAKVEYVRKAKWDHFNALVKSQAMATRQRRFLDAAVETTAKLSEDERDAALRYLDEMRHRVDEADPLQNPRLIVPSIDEPTAEHLAPWLKWNRL
ncbi:hypothetical protein [Microbacterium sp. MYb62]|uniref:hypothetical protein n=1 Tax=Microbacterium sp. MYb62 TaxID=1848690 RepID=UPI000CFCE702|nr:hypothetical protein [Microbacterium sp. MYb62]PRB08699.1 hypothetical protein CQ042_19770 [Microbacterium sp. MYb62]